jgi:cystathionine beta-lyase/cystathionine gamma-synthase
MKEKKFNRETEIVHQGGKVKRLVAKPEVPPIFLTTAFNAEDLDDLKEVYGKGFGYNRSLNPNRVALGELVTSLENGEDSIIASSGMAAITLSFLSNLTKGDHILSDMTLYGETIELLEDALENFGIETTFVDFRNIDSIKMAIKPNTKVLFAETISNPMISVVDIQAIAEIAHNSNAILIVDNTFATSYICKPLELGADICVNSLTKFANGHSDVVAGALTGSKESVKRAHNLQVLFGSTLGAFSSYLCQRGMRTMDLRVQRQNENASKLAAALEKNPNVLEVLHPSLESHPQHKLATRLFVNGYGGMLSFKMPDDKKKINTFMKNLKIARYAMTLGGFCTTMSHPVSSSHHSMPEDERLKLGITFGLMRVSVGIENADDLIEDFNQALKVFE